MQRMLLAAGLTALLTATTATAQLTPGNVIAPGADVVLHQPNDGGRERARLFEIEDTGETLRVSRAFP